VKTTIKSPLYIYIDASENDEYEYVEEQRVQVSLRNFQNCFCRQPRRLRGWKSLIFWKVIFCLEHDQNDLMPHIFRGVWFSDKFKELLLPEEENQNPRP